MISLDLDLLRTFVAIAETGNFSSAAKAVLRTPSAVSMQVKKMEDAVGHPLFIRDSRTVTLTEEGAIVLAHARRMLALDLDFMAEFHPNDVQGEVRLGIHDDVAERFLPDILRRLDRTHPGVVVNAVVTESENMIAQLAKGKLDLALVARLDSQVKERPGEVMMRERLVWAGCVGGIAHEMDPIPVTVWDKSCPWRIAGLEGLKAQGRPYRIALESGHLSGQIAAVKADLAVAPVPRTALNDDMIDVTELAELPQLCAYELVLVTRDDLKDAASATAEHLRACFATEAMAA